MDCGESSLVSLPDDPGIDTFLWYIYRKNMFTDVEFELQTAAEPITFSAHKMILAMWSPKFEDMFYRGSKQNLVCVKDVNPLAFKDMLRFMYGCDPVLDLYKDACELFKVANEFGVAGLATLCQNFLINVDVKVANVFDILEMAECMKNRTLRNRCMQLVENETKCILSSYECSDFTPSMIRILLNSRKLSLDSEFELLLWIFAWGKNMFLENSIYCRLREVLTEFLPQLNFLALTHVEFATICNHHQDFFTEDEALRIFMNIGIRGSKRMPDWYDENAELRVYTGKQDGVV